MLCMIFQLGWEPVLIQRLLIGFEAILEIMIFEFLGCFVRAQDPCNDVTGYEWVQIKKKTEIFFSSLLFLRHLELIFSVLNLSCGILLGFWNIIKRIIIRHYRIWNSQPTLWLHDSYLEFLLRMNSIGSIFNNSNNLYQ